MQNLKEVQFRQQSRWNVPKGKNYPSILKDIKKASVGLLAKLEA